MARSANDPDANQPAEAKEPVEDQANAPDESPQARQARAQAEADAQARKAAEQPDTQEGGDTPKASEVVVTTTDNEGNQVVLPPAGQVVNGPGESFNPARPGVSPDWPASRELDEEHDPAQNDGLTAEQAEYQAQEENVDNPDNPDQPTPRNPAPETSEQP